ncbi:MAG: chorismate mutase, partial [Asticcacaulis sp.]
MSSLDALRSQIDALDSELLRLIDARAALGQAIGEAKIRAEPDKAQVCLLRPDREALLIRKLLAMPRKAASDGLIGRIWHELISENLRIQGEATGGLNLTLSSTDPVKDVLSWARDRFGFAPSHSYVKDATAAIQAARDVRHISVLSLDPRGGAWWARLLAEPHVRIIAALPETSGARPLG